MTAFIYAIIVCVNSSRIYCHLVGRPFLFQSAEECVQAMSTRLGPGNLIGGKFYSANNGTGKTWYECDQQPTSQWAPVQ
jgi:hypothetical protein